MADIQIYRAPEVLASEINTIKNQTQNMMLYNSIEIGKRLVEAKDQLEHGQWGEWLENSVSYSKSTANNLMRIYEEYGNKQHLLLSPENNVFSGISYTQAVALLGVPAEEREAFIQEHDVENMSTREVQQAIKEREQALKEKDDAIHELNQLKMEKYNADTEKLKFENEKNKIKQELDSLIEKSKTDLEKKAAEAEKAKKQAEDLKKKIKELETKPIEVNKGASPEDVEQIRAEAIKEKDKELAALKVEKDHAEKRAKELESKIAKQDNEAILKYSIYFDELVEGFKKLLTELYKIKESDEEAFERYKKAVAGLIGKMSERL